RHGRRRRRRGPLARRPHRARGPRRGDQPQPAFPRRARAAPGGRWLSAFPGWCCCLAGGMKSIPSPAAALARNAFDSSFCKGAFMNWSGPHLRRRSPRPRRARYRPVLEALEDRTVPSTLTAPNPRGSGTGSLRGEIAASTSGDTIVFDPSLSGTITLTSGELALNHNLTIQGPGAGTLTVSGNDTSQIFKVD